MTEQGGFWDDAVVISTYTDESAVEDGVLVAVSETDRVTRPAFNWIEEHIAVLDGPPDRWPIDLMRWLGALDVGTKAVAAVRGVIGTHELAARRVWEQNTDGGILKFEHSGMTFWLIPHELGGITMMFPEDY